MDATTLKPELEAAGYQTQTFQIPEFRLEHASDRLKVLSRRAQKLGMPPFEMTEGEPYFIRASGEYGQTGGKIRMIPLTVTGGAPVLDGWRFFAKIEHEEPANLVQGFAASRAVENDPALLKTLTQCPPNCEHCNLKRSRNTTFIFQSTDDPSKRIQVGSSCVDDFSGHRSPDEVVAIATRWSDLIQEFYDDEEDGWGKPSLGQIRFDVDLVLAAACAIVRNEGRWVGRDAAGPNGSSVDWVQNLLVNPKQYHKTVTEGDHKQAETIAAWLRSDDFDVGGDLYKSNLQVMAHRGAVPFKLTGFLASAVATWNREQQRTQQRQASVSIKLGSPGEKITLDATVEKILAVESQFGVSDLTILKDNATQGKMVWFNSGKRWMTEGDTYHITGTVKGHEERDGLWQTKLTRVNSSENLLFRATETAVTVNKTFQKKLKEAKYLNARDGSGETALYIASKKLQFNETGKEVILALLDAGIDPTIKSRVDDMIPFDHWVMAGNTDLIRLGLNRHPEFAKPWSETELNHYRHIPKEARDLLLATRQVALAQEQEQTQKQASGNADDAQPFVGQAAQPEPPTPQQPVSQTPTMDVDDEEDLIGIRIG